MATWMANVTGKLQKLQAAIDAMSAQISGKTRLSERGR